MVIAEAASASEAFSAEPDLAVRLASSGEAVRAIQATLKTVAAHVADTEGEDRAAQLPSGEYLRDVDRTEGFSVDHFFLRVAAKEGADLPDAGFHARVVMDVLGEAVTVGELADVLSQLPESYKPSFEASSEGGMDISSQLSSRQR